MSFIRTEDNALISNDVQAYKAAKLRKQRERMILSFEGRITELETQVKELIKVIEEIKNK